MTQVKSNSLDIFDTVGNILGTISVADNVIQLDGNESLLKMIGDEASK